MKKRRKCEEQGEAMSGMASSFTLDAEQRKAQGLIMANDITCLIGHAGTGKTAVACFTALELLRAKRIDNIIITRPCVSSENLGSLPGTLDEKYAPWIMPIIDNLYKMLPRGEIQYYLKHEKIKIIPLQYMRGVTFDNALTIIDEAQNCTISQMKMILTRIGLYSRIVLSGDTDQIDLRNKSESGLMFIKDFEIPGFSVMDMQTEHRKPIVIDIIKAFAQKNF